MSEPCCPHCKLAVPDLCDHGQDGEGYCRRCPHCGVNVVVRVHINYTIEAVWSDDDGDRAREGDE